jgi:hypothetical protein
MNLLELIEKNGVENCMFLVPARPIRKCFGIINYTTYSDEEVIVPAKIVEERYKVADNYKITLSPIYTQYEHRHYYISDL